MGYSWAETRSTRQLWRFSSKSEVEALRYRNYYKTFIWLILRHVCIAVVRIHFVGAIFILILHRYRIALFRGILFTQVMGP